MIVDECRGDRFVLSPEGMCVSSVCACGRCWLMVQAFDRREFMKEARYDRLTEDLIDMVRRRL